jgi:hypothetical protein
MVPMTTAMEARRKKALETYCFASWRSSFPCAREIPFMRPLLMPKSENPRIAITELMLIHSPYRSVPRYLSASGTLIKVVVILTPLERPDAAVVRKTRRYRSFERPSDVLGSKERNRATDKTCFAVFRGASRVEKVIRSGIEHRNRGPLHINPTRLTQLQGLHRLPQEDRRQGHGCYSRRSQETRGRLDAPVRRVWPRTQLGGAASRHTHPATRRPRHLPRRS